jgi:hypothetical protein
MFRFAAEMMENVTMNSKTYILARIEGKRTFGRYKRKRYMHKGIIDR